MSWIRQEFRIFFTAETRRRRDNPPRPRVSAVKKQTIQYSYHLVNPMEPLKLLEPIELKKKTPEKITLLRGQFI